MRALLKNRRRTIRWSALVVLVMLSPLWWPYTAASRGQLRAHFDVWRGHYVVLVYGLTPPHSESDRLLRERYGIEVRTVALCVVSESLVSYANAYDGVSTAAANRKFGHDVFKECAEAAGEDSQSRPVLSEARK